MKYIYIWLYLGCIVPCVYSIALYKQDRSLCLIFPVRSPPEAPAEVRSVEVIKTVGQSSLMIGWERPPLDELGCSNGTFVYGYRVGIANYSSRQAYIWTLLFVCSYSYYFLSPLRCL